MAIREQQEQDIQKILSETKAKADHYQVQLSGEASQRKRINELESAIEVSTRSIVITVGTSNLW